MCLSSPIDPSAGEGPLRRLARIPRRIVFAVCGWLLLHLPGGSSVAARAADPPVDFARDVAPLLERRCIRCHLPGNAKGDLSLATVADLRRNEYILPGDPQGSYLIEVVTASDGQPPAMPKQGEPLSTDELALLRRWIAEGAHWPEEVVLRERSRADASWWSLQPLADVEPPVPPGLPPEWGSNPIDRFVYARLAEASLAPNPPAYRRTLIRRVTYDLTGLPPVPAEVDAFINDPDPRAYERLVDRLLASPRYGEQWGRHWLDVIRFGESNGYERNFIINDLWPFRDYVIRSINADKPFNEFIREHLAGDVLAPDQPQVEVGAAFLVAGPYDDVGNQDAAQAAQIRANTLDEIIRASGEAFLGLTIGCARCHDHKFDPILQRDYYAWYATFAGVRHGSRDVATRAERDARTATLTPLEARRAALIAERDGLLQAIQSRAAERSAEYAARWTRPPIDRRGTEEQFPAVDARFVRLISEGQDADPNNTSNFAIDEFEIWSADESPRNVALASNGARASGASRQVEDVPDAYGPQHAIDGRTGARFLATGGSLTIELPQSTRVSRILFSSARGEPTPEHRTFNFVGEYRIEASLDGQVWTTIADSHDRQPVNAAVRSKRLLQLEQSEDERTRLKQLREDLAAVDREIAAVPALPQWWVGTRSAADAAGPFAVFIGGSPQRRGELVAPASLSVLENVVSPYTLPDDAAEDRRRQALADWIVQAHHPLTTRVLVNRVWHYHFGVGLVDTPSDFGYMGGRPSHPELLDWLARQLNVHGWRLKPLHRLIVLSQTYQQCSGWRDEAAQLDGDARLLWRFPPRRLSAEEVRDTLLAVAGRLDTRMGGPGFRLYRFLQDNVATYEPLNLHGPETYRRAVYHQNARASVVDLMTDFDLPDCAFATPRRAQTTTPLQALTLLNHQFTLDMAAAFAERLQREAGDGATEQIHLAWRICYARPPQPDEVDACREHLERHGLDSLCRVLLNTSELISLP